MLGETPVQPGDSIVFLPSFSCPFAIHQLDSDTLALLEDYYIYLI